MPDERSPSKPPQLPTWTLAGEIGFAFCTPVVAAAVAGAYFDVGPIVMIILMLVGIAVGSFAAYMRIAPYLK